MRAILLVIGCFFLTSMLRAEPISPQEISKIVARLSKADKDMCVKLKAGERRNNCYITRDFIRQAKDYEDGRMELPWFVPDEVRFEYAKDTDAYSESDLIVRISVIIGMQPVIRT